jgi:hypothetical protein
VKEGVVENTKLAEERRTFIFKAPLLTKVLSSAQ